MQTLEQDLAEARRQQLAGNPAVAEQIYRRIVANQPDHAPALYQLSLLALGRGDRTSAEQLARAAATVDPHSAEYLAAVADALHLQGRWQEAADAYRQALELDNSSAHCHNHLGIVLQSLGDSEGALASLHEAVRLAPGDSAARHNLGVVLQERGQWPEAIEQFSAALAIKPDYHDARLKLGHALYRLGQVDQAIALFDRTTRAQPNNALAHCSLGIAYQTQRKLDAAVACFRRAIAVQPDFAEAHYNLGNALRALGNHEEAVTAFRTAARHRPGMVEAQIALANAHLVLVQPDESADAARRAIELDPNSGQAHGALAAALQFQGDMQGAIDAFRRAAELAPTDATAHSHLLYSLNFSPATAPTALFAEHLEWARRHAEPLTAAASPHAHRRDPQRRLRIGYVSSHFREHAVSAFAEPMIAAHDREQFDIYLYAGVTDPDATSWRYRTGGNTWRSIVGKSNAEIDDLIRGDEIDILVDLAGHIGGNYLGIFARKPAPIQVTYLGYQNTTGMSAMDYRLTDEHADPLGQTDAHYSEKLVRLPRSFFCYTGPVPTPPVNESPALASGTVTFASLNHISKLTPEAFETWARILLAVPNSRLVTLAYQGGKLERTVRDIMAKAGVDDRRISLVDKRPRFHYLRLHHSLDIALDTFPFNGHTTVCDALWMGVPSIMMQGETYASRFGGSTLVNVGLADLIARDKDEYVELAVNLACDVPRLAELRRQLRPKLQASPLMDARGFTQHLEAAYRTMWRNWCAQD